MYDINLSNPDLTPYLRRARLERSKAISASLHAGVNAIAKGLSAVKAAYVRGRVRQRTIRDLDALSDRELRDIGLFRGQIWSVADDLVNGATSHRTPESAPPRPAAVNQNQPGPHRYPTVPNVARCA